MIYIGTSIKRRGCLLYYAISFGNRQYSQRWTANKSFLNHSDSPHIAYRIIPFSDNRKNLTTDNRLFRLHYVSSPKIFIIAVGHLKHVLNCAFPPANVKELMVISIIAVFANKRFSQNNCHFLIPLDQGL